MSTGSAGILEGGVEASYLDMGCSMHTIWLSRIAQVAAQAEAAKARGVPSQGNLTCMQEVGYAVKAFAVLARILRQPLFVLPLILYVAIYIALEFDTAGGFLVIALFNDIMFGNEMELLRFYYGGKIKWGLQLDFGFWDFLKRGFREVVGEESNIGDVSTARKRGVWGGFFCLALLPVLSSFTFVGFL